jgi:hypothetical protein
MAEKTTAEIGNEILAIVRSAHSMKSELYSRVLIAQRFIKDFYRENHHFTEHRYAAFEHVAGVSIENIDAEGIFFDGVGYEDGTYITFDDLDNIETYLETDYEAFKVNFAAREEERIALQGRKLRDDLDALESTRKVI